MTEHRGTHERHAFLLMHGLPVPLAGSSADDRGGGEPLTIALCRAAAPHVIAPKPVHYRSVVLGSSGGRFLSAAKSPRGSSMRP